MHPEAARFAGATAYRWEAMTFRTLLESPELLQIESYTVFCEGDRGLVAGLHPEIRFG